ncbi:DUF2303 family protein [Dactylosporangium sp. NPDC005572]|uniref:DUF2303 family protein n=1 Tax=Dactylosporangium sp. NPDC005572 TaxID=3156889 RepID=UPI0033BB3204
MTTTVDGSAVTEIADLATAATEPSHVEPGKLYVAMGPNGPVTLDFTGDGYREQPKRKTGATTVRDVASFAAYWGKHHQPGRSEVYATRDGLKVTAVIDTHGSALDATGWGQHRLVLQLEHTTAYKAWTSKSGIDMSQEEFANFLEDNRTDIISPPAAEMLEVAQSIQATTKVSWASGHRLADGQRVLNYTEETESRSGTQGQLAIPAEIELALFVFKGAPVADQFVARFRHRLVQGQLKLQYRLDRPDDIVDAAFEGVVAEVTEACATTVLRGTPA